MEYIIFPNTLKEIKVYTEACDDGSYAVYAENGEHIRLIGGINGDGDSCYGWRNNYAPRIDRTYHDGDFEGLYSEVFADICADYEADVTRKNEAREDLYKAINDFVGKMTFANDYDFAAEEVLHTIHTLAERVSGDKRII